jgi:hypothetical protein
MVTRPGPHKQSTDRLDQSLSMGETRKEEWFGALTMAARTNDPVLAQSSGALFPMYEVLVQGAALHETRSGHSPIPIAVPLPSLREVADRADT